MDGKALQQDIIPPPMTLDPATLQNSQGTSYANVRMLGEKGAPGGDKINGNVINNSGVVVVNNGNAGDSMNPPFTIQNYNSDHHYKENHSEINC